MKSVKKRATISAEDITPLNVITRPQSDATTASSNEIVIDAPSSPITPVAAKRAPRKKSFPVVAVVTANGIQGNFMAEKRKPLIAHLPFSSTEVQFHDGPVSYDPRPPVQPQPFDIMENAFDIAASITDVYSGPPNQRLVAKPRAESEPPTFGWGQGPIVTEPEADSETKAATTTAAAVPIVEPLPVFTRMDLNLYSREGGVIEVPEKTDIACFWCAHQFEGRPVFLPYDEKDGVWHVYGNFCCPECALAYCIDEKEDQQLRWEKIALLHRLYANVIGGRIYPAPARTVLKLFGGRLSIEEYRITVRRGKVRIDIHYPPMVSLLATMDTKPIDFYETTIPKSFVPLNSERVRKVEEGLRLKRSKPLKDKESTLDACMNLQIRRS
jgi:hypothetical protein